MILVISCSLSKDSKSRHLALAAYEFLQKMKIPASWADLREIDLNVYRPYGETDGPVKELQDKISAADGILIAAPVYNYDVNSTAKSLIEHVGSTLNDKVVGMMVAAGGVNSFMAPISFMNSLMLDFQCVIVPKFVYGLNSEMERGIPAGLQERIEALSLKIVDMAERLSRPKA